MSETLLELQNLQKYFPIKGGFFSKTISQVYAVDGVSLKIRKGETLGLVGESGCGKSTLGKTALRLYEPSGGKIIFNGKDISTLPMKKLRSERRNMQIIFQDPFSSLNPRMTVGSILKEPFIIHNIGSKKEQQVKLEQLLELVGLNTEAQDRYPHEFSGGQRQRIGIARALALEPSLIIADEPVSALDVSIQSQILNLLSDLRKKFSLSYLFIAHDLAVIEHISHYVAVMYLGRIVEYTESEELYAHPLHPYTQALINAIPIPNFDESRRTVHKKVLVGDVPSPMNPPKGCHFHTRCPLATERCKQEAPKLRDLGTAKKPHTVACHFA
ncbi:MAG: ABC transporter ATP-binding protein [Oligoflexales bacterium]